MSNAVTACDYALAIHNSLCTALLALLLMLQVKQMQRSHAVVLVAAQLAPDSELAMEKH
jgi:hypothetical protein